MVPNYIYFHIPELNCFYLQAASRNVQLKGGQEQVTDGQGQVNWRQVYSFVLWSTMEMQSSVLHLTDTLRVDFNKVAHPKWPNGTKVGSSVLHTKGTLAAKKKISPSHILCGKFKFKSWPFSMKGNLNGLYLLVKSCLRQSFCCPRYPPKGSCKMQKKKKLKSQ